MSVIEDLNDYNNGVTSTLGQAVGGQILTTTGPSYYSWVSTQNGWKYQICNEPINNKLLLLEDV